jgi:alkylresorcinol/alkylpyrone synthase
MSYLLATTTAYPEHLARQNEVAKLMARLLGRTADQKSLQAVYRHASVIERRLMRPLSWYEQPHELAERNRIYLEEGVSLLVEACENGLDIAACPRSRIDHIITVSSSGLAAPSIDARLIELLGLRHDISRVPVWGLGCAGGVMGLAMALDHHRAYPNHNILLAALETCSLTFQLEDTSNKNLIGSALFGDGAGAVLLSGNPGTMAPPRLVDHTTTLFPGTERIMGWEIVASGFQLVLSPDLPSLVQHQVRPLVERFLARHDLAIADVRHWLLHPGGPKVLDAVTDALELTTDSVNLTRKVLAEKGNISSVSILAVLEKWLSVRACQVPGVGLMIAFGPGFSCAMVLFET